MLHHYGDRDIAFKEGVMGVTRNLGRAERVARVVIGIILIAVGFALSGVWKVLSIVVGIGIILTSLMGY